MAYTKLGRIRPVYSGEWSSSRAYTALEIVRTSDSGLSYIAQKDVPAGTPLTNGEYWAVVLDVREALTAAENAADRINAVMDVKANALAASVAGNPAQFSPDEHSIIKPVLTFEPIQEGSGDPYPAGGGKNLLENTAETQTINGVTFTVNKDGTVEVKGTATAETDKIICGSLGSVDVVIPAGSYIMSGSNAGTSSVLVLCGYGSKQIAYTQKNDVTFDAPDGLSWVLLRISAGASVDFVFYPMIRFASETDATYAPYANFRPITGRTGAKLARCKRNLLPNNAETQTINGIIFTVNADGTIMVNGTATANTYFYVDADASAFKVGKEYIISGCPPGGSTSTYRVTFQYYDASNALKFLGNDIGEGSKIVCTEAMKNPQWFIVVYSGVTVSNLTFRPMIRLASDTDATFEPYQGKTFALDFGQTVHGGALDWDKGEMAVDWRFMSLDGSETWEMDTGEGWSGDQGNSFYTKIYGNNGIHNGEVVSNAYATAYRSNLETAPENSVMISAVGGEISFVKTQYKTVDEWKAYLAAQHAAGTPVQVAYKLAAPTTIQLTPQQITALKGVNTLYGNADNITVQYNKSLNAAFEELKNAILAMGGNV